MPYHLLLWAANVHCFEWCVYLVQHFPGLDGLLREVLGGAEVAERGSALQFRHERHGLGDGAEAARPGVRFTRNNFGLKNGFKMA